MPVAGATAHHRAMPLPKTLIPLAIACVLLIGVPAAQADSIAYVKDGNVWLSTSDGARQVQVTQTGGYTDVTQADDGTMIGLNGVRLHRLARDGKLLADFDTPVSSTSPGKSFHGPFDPAISPDGSKVAYTYYWMSQGSSPTCYPPQCAVAYNEGGTGYSHADRQTGWEEIGKHSGWRHPAWVDDDTVMLANPTHLPNRDVVLDTISDGPPGMAHNWFSDTVQGNPHVSGGDITRDKRKLAFQTGENDSTLSIYYVPLFPTSFPDGEPQSGSDPHICYRYSNPDGGRFSQPTFSPDGGQVAWAEGNGVHIAAVPAFASGCSTDGATASAPLVIPGASEPDWGPADVPVAAAPVAPPAPVVTPRAAAPTVRASVKHASLSKGIKLEVTVPAAGRLGAVAKRGTKTVASAAGKKVAAGRRTVTLRFTKAARRALRRNAKVAVTVRFTPATGKAQTARLTAKVR